MASVSAFSLSKNQIAELCAFSTCADREARSDLIIQMIVSENDYTSNFTGALRRIINSNSKSGLSATSQVLPKAVEQRTGCDAAIVVQSSGYAKVLLLEAKWPRFKVRNHAWDTLQKSTGTSHFSDQLTRQATHIPPYAIAEMILCEYAFGHEPYSMDASGSSCIWHADAKKFDSTRTSRPGVWKQNDLAALLVMRVHHPIAEIVMQMCLCNEGTPIRLSTDGSLDSLDIHLPSDVLVIRAGEDPSGAEGNKQ